MAKELNEAERNNVLFRTAFKGYNKQDVNDFIDSLIRSNERNADHYSSHIRSIEEDRAENAKMILELSKRNDILTGIVQSEAEARLEIESSCDDLKIQLENANKEIEEYKSQLSSVKCELDSAVKRLEDNPDKHKLEELTLQLEARDEQIYKLEKTIEQLKKQPIEANADRKQNFYARLRGTQSVTDKIK